MTRGLWKDPDRYMETYWSKYDDVWFHGDWALVDEGLWYLHGRVDDVIKVSGHRIASAEIESVLTTHPSVAEAVAVGVPHEVKGEAIVVYVVLKNDYTQSLRKELKEYVARQVGKIARPEDVRFVKDLPKTRTGKMVRRLIRAKVTGEEVGDMSSLENPDSVKMLDEAL
jgi:acetyl-CoA synthetase